MSKKSSHHTVCGVPVVCGEAEAESFASDAASAAALHVISRVDWVELLKLHQAAKTKKAATKAKG